MENLHNIDKDTLNEVKWEFVSKVLHRNLKQYDGVGAPKGIFPNETRMTIKVSKDYVNID